MRVRSRLAWNGVHASDIKEKTQRSATSRRLERRFGAMSTNLSFPVYSRHRSDVLVLVMSPTVKSFLWHKLGGPLSFWLSSIEVEKSIFKLVKTFWQHRSPPHERQPCQSQPNQQFLTIPSPLPQRKAPFKPPSKRQGYIILIISFSLVDIINNNI